MNIKKIKSPIGDFIVVPVDKKVFAWWATVLQLWTYRPDEAGFTMPQVEVIDLGFGHWQPIGLIKPGKLLVRNLKKTT